MSARRRRSSPTSWRGRAWCAARFPIRACRTSPPAWKAAAPRKSRPTTSAAASRSGEVGFTIEFGRPGVGVWFRDMQKMCWALAEAGVSFEKKNPITSLMSDVPTGTIREDILNEKVMSAIVEIKVPVERTEEIIRLVWEVEKEIDTVVAHRRRARAATRTARTPWSRRSSRSSATNSSAPRPTSAWAASPIAMCRAASGGGGPAMTNTLHRFGDAESFRDDYVVFAIASRGKNEQDAVPKLKKFLEIALRVQAGESRRRPPRRRAAPVAIDESAVALEPRRSRPISRR